MLEAIKAVFYMATTEVTKEERIGGVGVHGYLYIDTPPKKGTGNPRAVPLQGGYKGPLDNRNTVQEGDRVTPVEYVDIVASITKAESGITPEAIGIREIYKFLSEREDITEATIFVNREPILRVLESTLDTWVKNDFKTSTNKRDIKDCNIWREASDYKIKVRAILDNKYVLTLNSNYGDDLAIKLSKLGKIKAIHGDDSTKTVVTKAEGYYLKANPAPRLLTEPRWYFSSRFPINEYDGKKIMFVGSHGTTKRELEYVGKPYADNYLGVILTNDVPDVLLEFHNLAYTNERAKYDKVMVANLTATLSKSKAETYPRFGLDYTYRPKDIIQVIDEDDFLLLSEMIPQGQGYRMYDQHESQMKKLKDYLEKKPNIVRTDIKDRFFEMNATGKRQILKHIWTQRDKFFDTIAAFNFNKASDHSEIVNKKIRLLIGKDMLSRNQLAALAPNVVEFSILTYRDGENQCRYLTYMELDNGDKGIWARYESNLVFNI